jgi:hypothetical protein
MRFFPLVWFLGNFAQAASYSFQVRINPDSISVASPAAIQKEVSIIFFNNTSATVYGKIYDPTGTFSKYLGIPSQRTKSVVLKGYNPKKVYYFMPLSPPLQEQAIRFIPKGH